jgi:hypothetical protein
MDTGATGAAGSANTELEAVDALKRAENCGR